MALFGSRTVTADKLPNDMDSLKKKAEKLLDKNDLQGAFVCCEKAISLPNTYRWFYDQMAGFYARGEVCEKNLEKARKYRTMYNVRELKSNAKYFFNYNRIRENYKLYGAPDYHQLFLAMADACIAEEYGYGATVIFHTLREWVHLYSIGLKDAFTEAEYLQFFENHSEDQAAAFWGKIDGNLHSYTNLTKEEILPFISDDSAVQRDNFASYLSRVHHEKYKDTWKNYFPDSPGFYEKFNFLRDAYLEHYSKMTPEYLLNTVYAEEEAWQEANSAEAKAAEAAAEAAQLAEEERIATGERLYRNGLLYCGLGNEETGLVAMQEALRLGNQHAGLWLVKHAAHNGNAEAYCILGDLSMEGTYGMVQDELAAYGYYLAACRGSGRANAALCEFYRHGLASLDADEAMADGFFAASVELGYAPSCLQQANLAMIKEEWEKAEHALNRLAEKTEKDEQGEVFVALAALADLYQRKGDSKKALEYAIRFADLDYAMDPEDQNWQQYRSGVIRKEEKAIYEMYRFYCLYHNSGPAKRNEGSMAAPYIRGVGLAFSAVYCDILRARYKAGDYKDTVAALFTQLMETGHKEEALQWAERGFQAYNSQMCYLAATLYADELDVDDEDKIEYLRRGAVGSDEYSQLCKDTLKGVNNAQREAWRAKRKAERARIAQAEAQRQATINEKMDVFRSRMDLLERDIDLALTGDGSTFQERVIRGDVSVMDGVSHQSLRDLAEEKFRKKLED